jgi:hypothetical protein
MNVKQVVQEMMAQEMIPSTLSVAYRGDTWDDVFFTDSSVAKPSQSQAEAIWDEIELSIVQEEQLDQIVDDKSEYTALVNLARSLIAAYDTAIRTDESLSATYTRYRTILENASTVERQVFIRHARQVTVIDIQSEVTPMTDDYQVEFNQAVLSLMTILLHRLR